MALEQLDLETGLNKVELISLLKAWEPPEGYYLAFSGGKDSVVIYDLAQKAGVKFDAHYCVSPIDPPQIYSFIKEYYPDVVWDYHARGFWKLVVKKGLPMRHMRWCCEIIKEAGGKGRVVIVGNRSAEGNTRRKQCFVEANARNGETFIRPILKFDDYDIWQYIRENHLPYCSLYDEGFKRIGCVLCPFSRNIAKQEAYFPKIVANWKRACERIVANNKARGYLSTKGKPLKYRFETGEELYQWWTKRR
jgi:phosphoadenosine phosphosulfate reductase